MRTASTSRASSSALILSAAAADSTRLFGHGDARRVRITIGNGHISSIGRPLSAAIRCRYFGHSAQTQKDG